MTAPVPLRELRLGTRELAALPGRAATRRGPTRPRSTQARRRAARACRRSCSRARRARCGTRSRAVSRGQRLPAARGRLRGVVRRVLGRQHPRQAQGHPPDVGRAHVQHRRPDAEGRAHRRPVRQAALVADREARRHRAAVVLRRHRQRLRVRRRRPPARPAAHGARLQPGRGDAQPAARVHEGRLRRPQPRAPVEPRVHRAAAARAAATTSSPTEIERALRFMAACGIDLDAEVQLHEVDFYTSHEALLLGYEEALTRRDSLTGDWYDCSAHLLWIGDRTRQLDGAHVEFLSGVQNPIGVKLGPDVTPDDAGRAVPPPRSRPRARPAHAREPHGRRQRRREAPAAAARGAARRPPGRVGVRPDARQHVRARERLQDAPLRRGDARGRAVLRRAAAPHDVWPGGVHVELTGDDVTECLGGGDDVRGEDLEVAYETALRPAAERPPVARPRVPRSPSSSALTVTRRWERPTEVDRRERARRREPRRARARTRAWSTRCTACSARTRSAVSEGWREFFADYTPARRGRAPPPAPAPAAPAPAAPHRARAAPRRRRQRRAPVALDGETRRAVARRGGAHRREHGGEPRGPDRHVGARGARPSCSRSTARSSTTTSRAPAAARSSFTHLIGFAVLRALQSRAAHERELRRRRRHAERRAPRAREPRPRDRPAEVRRHAHAARAEHQERRHARLRRASTPRTRTSSAGRAPTSSPSTTSRAPRCRSRTRARSARCTRCRASCPARA